MDQLRRNVTDQSSAYRVQLRNLNKLLFHHLSHSNFVSLWLEDMPLLKKALGLVSPCFCKEWCNGMKGF